MTSRAHKGRSADPRQTDFLQLLGGAMTLPALPMLRTDPGALDYDQETRRLLTAAIYAGPHRNRDDLAEAIAHHAGRPVSKAQIDSWTGASRPHRLPADLVPAICAATGNTVLLEGLAEACGCGLADSAAAVQARLDQLALVVRMAKAEARRLVAHHG